MSDYCTNCAFLAHSKGLPYVCKKNNPNKELTTLCGNPLKLLFCKKEDWYIKKSVDFLNMKRTAKKEDKFICASCGDEQVFDPKDNTSNNHVVFSQCFKCGKNELIKPVKKPYSLESVCMSFRHDFGLLDEAQQQVMRGFVKDVIEAYEKELAYTKPEKTCTLNDCECRIVFSRVTGLPESLAISFDEENKQRLIKAYGKRDIKKLVICEVKV